MQKTCTNCKKTLSIDLFVICRRNKDGHGAKCKDCHKAICDNYVKANTTKRLKSSQEYYKRNKEKHRKLVTEWRKKNPEVYKEIKGRYIANNRDKILQYIKLHAREQMNRQRAMYPERYKARNKVNNAIASGKLPKASALPCYYCGGKASEYHHYKGYDLPNWLEVLPVCKGCHVKAEKLTD